MLGVVFLVGFRSGSRYWTLDVDLKFLKLEIDEVEGCCDDGIGSFDSLKGEYTELEFVYCSRCGVLQGLNLEQENRCCGVDAICER